eukprot:TRINITY_DN8633_c0_g1_i3.p1 TRINITY_DN8633_c0_g1~~TRINITY_DN8633_c0_g1_i3.p1  ORF type:complete len:192 (+),score=22.09 TRINITY_DN8633_c0_g1_i3:666-1241(+)
MALPHRRRSCCEREYPDREYHDRERRDLAHCVRDNRMRQLVYLLAACHLQDNRRVTLRQLVLTQQRPEELARNYINQWLDLAHKCEDPSYQSMWISLCLQSMHRNLRILTFAEDFETFDEMSRVMSNIKNNILCPSKGWLRMDLESESDSKDVDTSTNSPVMIAGYEPPLPPWSSPYPTYRVEGANFAVPP